MKRIVRSSQAIRAQARHQRRTVSSAETLLSLPDSLMADDRCQISQQLGFGGRVKIRPYFDRRDRSVISPIFPYDFRRSLGASENGRVEQSGTEFKLAAE